MLVHVEIAFCLQLQIKDAVPGKKFQHVIEKANTTADLRATVALDEEVDADVGLVCLAMDSSPPHTFAALTSPSSIATCSNAGTA